MKMSQTAILNWVDKEFAENRTDTIHDFLAYLAEQMINLNKKKNEETKGFLKWLECTVDKEIDSLTGKTILKNYHQHDLNALLEVLRKNRKSISIDPTTRKIQETLEKHFAESMSLLSPLKDKISASDDLIDQIVYRLYGLTDEEIGLVEGKGE